MLQTISTPAKHREIAALIARLMAHYWTDDVPTATRRAMAEDWLEDLAGFEVEVVAAACADWRRQPGGRRPTPGDIYALCVERQAAEREHAMLTDERNRRWPAWLAEVWGPEPDGPIRRAEAMMRGEVTNV